MQRPHSGGTAYVITVSPVPGEYTVGTIANYNIALIDHSLFVLVY